MFYCAVLLTAAYTTLSFHPDALFPVEYTSGNVTLHSRVPLHQDSRAILTRVLEKLAATDFFDPEEKFEVYFTGDNYLHALLVPFCGKTFSCLHPATDKVFITSADFEKNRAYPRGGGENPRVLESVLTHELVKAQLKHKLGTADYFFLPDWKKDGYAEHIAMETAELEPEEICTKKSQTATRDLYLKYRLAIEMSTVEGDSYPELIRTARGRSDAVEQVTRKYCRKK